MVPLTKIFDGSKVKKEAKKKINVKLKTPTIYQYIRYNFEVVLKDFIFELKFVYAFSNGVYE
jgi:hypothetical protein